MTLYRYQCPLCNIFMYMEHRMDTVFCIQCGAPMSQRFLSDPQEVRTTASPFMVNAEPKPLKIMRITYGTIIKFEALS